MQHASQSKSSDSGCVSRKPSRDEHEPNYCETEPGRWVGVVKEFIQDLNYGEVVLSVHGGRVVQVERTEKVRLS